MALFLDTTIPLVFFCQRMSKSKYTMSVHYIVFLFPVCSIAENLKFSVLHSYLIWNISMSALPAMCSTFLLSLSVRKMCVRDDNLCQFYSSVKCPPNSRRPISQVFRLVQNKLTGKAK